MSQKTDFPRRVNSTLVRTATCLHVIYIMKKFGFILAIFLPLLAFTPVYADAQDITYTYNSQNSPDYVCGGNTGVICSDYNYLILTTNYTFSGGSPASLAFYANIDLGNGSSSVGQFNMPLGLSSSTTYTLPTLNSLQLWFVGTPPSGYEITLTLTNSAYTCPSCPSCPDCSDPLIVRLFGETFWSVAQALVAVIVPILALFLVFRLIHDLMWGR